MSAPHVRPRVSTAFPSLNEAPHQLAVLEHEGATLLALGTGCYVAVVGGELCEVVQLVGPQAEPVSCADWFRAGCDASFAVGAGCMVSFYSDSRDGAERWVANGVAAHEQPVHALKWAGPAVWTAAGCALALWACSGDLWSKQWSCNLSQPAELMAPSADGALLATAGRFDRLVKVWHRRQDGFAFSYLHHPHGLQSIEWTPLATESGLCAASSRNVLLTLCRGGVARLWSSTHAPEPEPLRFDLCASLPLSGLAATGAATGQETADPSRPSEPQRAIQSVQWLQTTSRACLPRIGVLAEATSARSPSGSVPVSPSRGAAPSPGGKGSGLADDAALILRPSLAERHIYAVAILADGTMVVWLVLGLFAVPRCAPKLMVWANLPQALPRVERIMSGAAFCHFTAAAYGDEQSSGKDQLPSAVSLVQHVRTADGWSVRLCSIDVERGSGERLQQRLLSGHPAQAHVCALLPHPSCTLLATLDDGGELLLWECCFQADQLGRPPSPETDQSSAESSAIQQLARLPGSFQAAAWLSLAATALVAAEPSGLSVFCRAPDGRWLQGPKLAAPDGPGVPGLWLSLHAFANAVPVAAESPHAMRSECTGFALRSDGYLGLWRVSLQAGPAQPPAFEWVGQAEISGATCATPLVRAAGCNGRLGRATARRLCLLGQALTVHSGWRSALYRRWVSAPPRAPWEAEARSSTLQLLGFSLAGARPALARGSGRGGGDRGRDRELRLRGQPSFVGGHLHWPQQRRIGRTPPAPPRERRGARLAACWHDDAASAQHGPCDGRPRAPGGRVARSRGLAALLKVAFCGWRHRLAATARQPQPQLGSAASPRMGPPVAGWLCTLESRVRAAQIATRAVVPRRRTPRRSAFARF